MKEIRRIGNEVLLGEVSNILSKGKRVKFRAKGKSMVPFIRDEDILVVMPVGAIRKGEVVLAKTENMGYVVHRIMEISGTDVVLMGDGNLYAKEYCSHRDVVGNVVSLIRNGKERSLCTKVSRLKAYGWHMLLPFRRMAGRIRNLNKNIMK